MSKRTGEFMKLLNSILFACVLAFSASWVPAQEKKDSAAEPLALNVSEKQVLDNFIQRSNVLSVAAKEVRKEFEEALKECLEARTQKEKLAGVDRLIVAAVNADKDKQKEEGLNKEVEDWLKAVRNRLKCEDCLLDVDKQQLRRPEEKQTESKKD